MAYGLISYQELRYRRVQNILILATGVTALIHLGVSSSDWNTLILAGITTGFLGVIKLTGLFKTADWLCCSALFVFLFPFGIHVAVFTVLIGFALTIGNHMFACLASNIGRKDPFPEIDVKKHTKFFAALCCKRRGPLDRFAYPAVTEIDGVMTFNYKSGMAKKKIDLDKNCKYVIPSIPILTFMYGVSLIMIYAFHEDIFFGVF